MHIERDIALNEAGIQPVRLEFSTAPGTPEETSFVRDSIYLYYIRAGQRRLDELHGSTSTEGIGTTNFPPHSRI